MRVIRFLVLITLLGIVMSNASAQDAIISIDNVTNEYSPTQLVTGRVHQVSIRYNCLGLLPSARYIGDNGFEVYSPDGANWVYLEASVGPLVATAGPVISYLKHYNYDSATWSLTGNDGADPAGGSTGLLSRAGFYFATLSISGEGFVGGSDNGIAVTFEFATDPSQAEQGYHICVDTSNYFTRYGHWEWSAPGDQDFPLWDNGLGVSEPRCWELWHDCCCYDRVGDANRTGGDEPTIGDVSVMIDAKFISGTCLGVIECLQEADVNKSGGHVPTCDDVTIGDISILIDYLFITGPELGLPYCMQ